MRTRLLLLPVAYVMLSMASHAPNPTFDVNAVGGAGPGRGLVNPPTVYEIQQSKCLATMVYGEARGEKKQGMIAVAYTSLNRAANKSVCSVVLAPEQYSIFNDNPALRAAAMSPTLDPRQKNVIDQAGWRMAQYVADDVLMRKVPDPTFGATHYVAYKSLHHIPTWTYKFKRTVVIGNHTFFKDKSKVIAQ